MSKNPRVIGAFVVGFALIAGTYVVVNFGSKPTAPNAAAVVEAAPVRTPIKVTDNNKDGLEDWRNSLEVGSPINLSDAPEIVKNYVRPDTLTDDFSVEFFEQVIRSRSLDGFGSSEEEIIDKSLAEAAQRASDTLYDERDLTIIADDPEIIRAYGNRAANILLENEVPNSINESLILKKALDRNTPEILSDLTPQSNMYATMRDQLLATPVPQSASQAHLNLINVFHVLHKDIEGMKQVFDDPMYSLVRIKRYQDDATGLAYALQTMYLQFAQTPDVFQPNDSALLFLAFAPTNNPN